MAADEYILICGSLVSFSRGETVSKENFVVNSALLFFNKRQLPNRSNKDYHHFAKPLSLAALKDLFNSKIYMIKYFKTFFYPNTLTFSYNQSKENVLAKIEEVLKRKVTFLSSKDMKGRFLNGDTFVIDVVSPAYTRGVKYSSTLIGQVIELDNGTTQIKTKAKPSIALYFLFFVTIVFGVAYLYKFIQTGSTNYLFWSLAMLIIGPSLSIGFSNVAIGSIRERYKMYIDKELKTGHTAASIGIANCGA